MGACSSHIAVQGQGQGAGRRPGTGQGDGESGVGPQIFLVLRAVQLYQLPVNSHLVQGILPLQGRGNLVVYILHRVLHSQAKIPGFPVSELHRLKPAGTGS